MSVTPFYRGWDRYNSQLVAAIRDLTPEQLALRPAATHDPVWATVAHTAGARAYWLCGVLREPGAETTPFPLVVGGVGWEDDPATARSATELVAALESTWRLVEQCLERWTPESLDEPFVREYAGRRSRHSRQSVLIRLLGHDAYHSGEISLTLGSHGIEPVDLWPPAPALNAARS